MNNMRSMLLVVVLFAAGLLHAGPPVSLGEALPGEQVRLERPVSVADLGGCVFFRGILSLPHCYIQGADGRVVLEAEDATTTNIGAEGAVGPFSSTEQNLIGTDRRASLDRFVAFARGAKWERAQWTFAIAKPAKFTTWYRIFVTDVGECAHTETLNGKGGERIVVFQTTNTNDKLFHRWQWVKGRAYDFIAGANVQWELLDRGECQLERVNPPKPLAKRQHHQS